WAIWGWHSHRCHPGRRAAAIGDPCITILDWETWVPALASLGRDDSGSRGFPHRPRPHYSRKIPGRKKRMAQSRKVIITCAVTGSIHTPSMSPHLPVTASEIADAAIGAAEAGAAVVHLHARDPKDGRPDQSPAAFPP